jgi:hypothetical protein
MIYSSVVVLRELLLRKCDTMADLSIVYTVLALVSVAYFVSRTLLKTPAYKEKSFPVYGPLEIAFTTYAVTTQGWLHRIA